MAGLEDEITESVRSFAARAREGQGAHAAPEDLIAYHEGQLSAGESEALRDHLAVCARCADLALDLANFPAIEPAAPAQLHSSAELAERWQSIRERLAAEGDHRLAPRTARQESPARSIFHRLRPLPVFLAAGLFAACLALALWALTLRQRVSDLSQPAVRVAVSSLVPRDSAAARDRGGAEPAALPGWADRLLLILNVFEPDSYAAYQVEIFDARGVKVWTSRDLRRAPDGNFALEVPRGFLPAGTYRIELSGLDGTRREKLAVYNLLFDFD